MKLLYLDAETRDHGIDSGLGAGWPYKDKLKVIGFSFATNDTAAEWRQGTKNLVTLVSQCDAIVCHNASYDIGILHMLGIEYQDKLIYDTLLMAKLNDNRLMKYNLNSLAERYFGESKLEEDFIPIAWELGLVKSKSQNAVKYAKGNLDKVYAKYPGVVAAYANQDVDLTKKLFLHLLPKIEDQDFTFYSDLIKAVIQTRAKGVRVDIARIFESREIIEKDLFKVNQTLSSYLQGRNPNSTQQLAQICDELNITYPQTALGNPSITAKWIEQQDGEFFSTLNQYKKLNKLITDFIDKTVALIATVENITIEEVKNLKYSRIHPEINIMGAAATGRFSGSNPNIQQVPKRDEYSKPLIRSMFVPEDGESWYCADFSAQEPRLQVHYAARINSPAGIKMAKDWSDNPNYDMHNAVAIMVGIDRKAAKTINLGLSYGMGVGKLSKSLDVSLDSARELVKQYHKGAPYLKDLVSAAKSNIVHTGYIKTILNRKLYKDDTVWDDDGRENDFSYKAINKLIQGSAADQTMAAMVLCYRYGIVISFPVHDELCISSSSNLEITELKYIMENAIRLKVPNKSEVTVGNNFADQTDCKLLLNEFEQLALVKFTESFTPLIDQS
jgi:DNA polymerase I-like protein with 3'-5' exonuclease and polymerase domains